MSQNLFISQGISKRTLVTTLLISAVLAGCSSQPGKIVEQPLPAVEFAPAGTDELLDRAQRSPFPESARLKIQAANQLISGQMVRAQTILDSLNYEELPDDLKAEMALSRAKVAEQAGQNWEIFFWLDRASVINSSNVQLLDASHTLKARAYNRYREYVTALDEWSMLSNISELDKQPENRDAFWETLLNAPEERLITLGNQTSNETMKGWLELALVYRPGKSLDQQLNDLSAWRNRWQNHPAITYLPKDISALQVASTNQPDKITLLLPVSGPLASAGRAIRDGFLAAYYQNLSDSGENIPEVTVMDTNGKNVIELANEAKNQGTELIIGPLDKINVSLLKENTPEGVTVLALNTLEDSSSHNAQKDSFFEYGLATEDEARAVARRGILDGHRRVLILRPETSWGDRATNSFVSEWTSLGGEIAGISEFNSKTEFSQLAGQALLVDESQKRAKELNRILREKLGFEPRRRHDVDMIYMPSNPKEARQLKPALSYQFAGKLPVYATSSAYSGRVSPSRDQDLDNLRVPVMNWYLPDNKGHLESNIRATWSSARGQYGSLYAMGADAFTLYPRLQQLASLPGSRLEGLTGLLSINSTHHVERELSWQVFRNGRLRPLPIPVQDKPDVLAVKAAQ
ncbi:penicillin-binding protein activator [Endozoicomonas arenosclerae]|uniref:penicillin-binding protein activator n=1 Tax=Endozoicomonas arenosclerae TaxID=1633495 RepID=UPI000784DE42|nr:penicillin-binding protein activator [Endozoicomonas arenosclerae]